MLCLSKAKVMPVAKRCQELTEFLKDYKYFY